MFVKFSFLLALVLIIFLNGCVDNRYSECNQLIEITLNIADKTKTVYSQGDNRNPEKAGELANAFQEAVLDLNKLKIQDKTLLKYRQGFAKMYFSLSQNTRDFVTALRNKNLERARLSTQTLQKQAITEQELVTGLSNYCQGSVK